jgi:hypothetical protein
MNILTITNMTFREAWRKKIFWLALVLGVAFLILFAIGFHYFGAVCGQFFDRDDVGFDQRRQHLRRN